MTPVDLTGFQWPQSIRSINGLPREQKEAVYHTLIAAELLTRFNVRIDDPQRLRIVCPQDTRSVEIFLFRQPDDPDPVLYLHMADTLNYQIAILLLVINDVASPRFNVDLNAAGMPTRFGTLRRNIPEEIRAKEAGLAPGQVYKGLRMSEKAMPLFETFITRTGHDLVIIEPLTYNNAIVYERYGFAYFQGRQRMEWIDKVLRAGGEFIGRFDDASPFRQHDAWRSIRGRAWAIHDGILGEPFGNIRMYKRIGHKAGISTFPDGIW